MKLINRLILLLLLFYGSHIGAQKVNWIVFDALSDSLRAHPRPVLIFIHTDWCKYCALQDHNTFGEPGVIHLLNENYYALRLNAETTEDITFLNRTYRGRLGNYHELATFLGREAGRLAFPTTLLLSQHLQPKNRLVGFTAAEFLSRLLVQ